MLSLSAMESAILGEHTYTSTLYEYCILHSEHCQTLLTCLVCPSIHTIPDETFEDLHSLEWLKLWNNELEGLSYSLMEPVLDTLKHLDIHSKC